MGITMSSAVPSETSPPAALSLSLPDPDKIDPEDIAEWIRTHDSKNLVIVDVRDDDFVEGGHIKGCINIPSGVFMDKWSSCDGLLTKYAANSEAQVIDIITTTNKHPPHEKIDIISTLMYPSFSLSSFI